VNSRGKESKGGHGHPWTPFPCRCLERFGEVAACQAAKYGWTSQLRRNVSDTDVRW